jgi:hypothetical protein
VPDGCIVQLSGIEMFLACAGIVATAKVPDTAAASIQREFRIMYMVYLEKGSYQPPVRRASSTPLI